MQIGGARGIWRRLKLGLQQKQAWPLRLQTVCRCKARCPYLVDHVDQQGTAQRPASYSLRHRQSPLPSEELQSSVCAQRKNEVEEGSFDLQMIPAKINRTRPASTPCFLQRILFVLQGSQSAGPGPAVVVQNTGTQDEIKKYLLARLCMTNMRRNGRRAFSIASGPC